MATPAEYGPPITKAAKAMSPGWNESPSWKRNQITHGITSAVAIHPCRPGVFAPSE